MKASLKRYGRAAQHGELRSVASEVPDTAQQEREQWEARKEPWKSMPRVCLRLSAAA